MALNQKQKGTRERLVSELDLQIRDKTDLLSRLEQSYLAEKAKVEADLDELTLRRDGLATLK